MYHGYGITFDSTGSWSFDNDYARNVIICSVDNTSSFHVDNCKKNFLALEEGPTFGVNGSFGSPEKKCSINFTKANTKFCLSLHYNAQNSYLFANGKKSFILKPTIKIVTLQLDFVLEGF